MHYIIASMLKMHNQEMCLSYFSVGTCIYYLRNWNFINKMRTIQGCISISLCLTFQFKIFSYMPRQISILRSALELEQAAFTFENIYHRIFSISFIYLLPIIRMPVWTLENNYMPIYWEHTTTKWSAGRKTVKIFRVCNKHWRISFETFVKAFEEANEKPKKQPKWNLSSFLVVHFNSWTIVQIIQWK